MNAETDQPSEARRRVHLAEFSRSVLEHMPSPVLVVDGAANLTYANKAMLELVGRPNVDIDDIIGENVLDSIHPDDVGLIAEAFVDLAGKEPDIGPARLAPIHFRMVSPEGDPIPVEVTGSRTITHDTIQGIIFDVRPARHHDVMAHLLTGIAAGSGVADLLRLVTELVALPPLNLDAAVLERSERGWTTVASTSPLLEMALSPVDSNVFNETKPEPHRCEPDELGVHLAAQISAAGYVDTWRLSVPGTGDGADDVLRYEIVACNPIEQRVSPVVAERMSQARELAGIVMLRSQNDRRLEHAASHDGLTGILNRGGFRDRIAEALPKDVADSPNDNAVTIIFLDLDGFKPINDEYGHEVGDAVLKVVASRLGGTIRPGDAIGRLGGDEFAVLLKTNGAPVSTVRAIGERIVEALGAPISIPGSDIEVIVSASAGISTMRPGDSVDDVLRRADSLMYQAKRSGGGQARFEGTTS